MKRQRNNGEWGLTHSTEGGDAQTVALSDDNFDPAIVRQMPSMEHEEMLGYRLEIVERSPTAARFYVVRAGRRLTYNTVDVSEADRLVWLHTVLYSTLEAHEASMVADMEQCAAIALTRSQDAPQIDDAPAPAAPADE